MSGKLTTLNPEEINHLGLPSKHHNRYSLGKAKLEKLYKFRGNDDAIIKECLSVGIRPDDVKHYWYKGEHFSINATNKSAGLDNFKNDLINGLKVYSPKFPKIKRIQSIDDHLLVIDPADIHIGKLSKAIETGEEYNEQIAVRRVKEGVKGILNKSKGFKFDKILFIGGNDILHVDTPNRTTTSGTPQDTDGMWYENFETAKQLYVDVLEMLISVADVHFVFNPSNHDYMSGFMLADVVKTYFRKCKNITFDCDISHRKYYLYGNSLIGTSHGDGAKQQDLGSLMSIEAKEHWADSEHRYFYTHHVHHKSSKDYINITVETLRSPSGADSWHSKKGYKGSPKAVEGFIHCKENGQICRITHIF